ncbi:MAG: haloacid dehalogenase-like hydrolase [Terriglobales bacterium]
MTSLNDKQSEFIATVLNLKPRIAAFDCDGTLWSGDAGEGFFSWELEQGLVPEEIARWARPRYADYRAGNVPEEIMCGEMVTMHRGLREEIVQQAADKYFALGVAANIFPEMRELVRQLRESGCEVWAVSSSNQWIIRSGMKLFGIPQNRILAAEVAIENGVITDRLVRVPSGRGKVEALRAAIKDPLIEDSLIEDSLMNDSLGCAFGNAIWDREMLALAKHPFVINPNPNLREIAVANHWTVYQPDVNHQTR